MPRDPASARATRSTARRVDLIPTGAEAVARCEPIYETLPGWSESTVGAQIVRRAARRRARLPAAHRGADRRADRDGVDRPRSRRDDPRASSVRRRRTKVNTCFRPDSIARIAGKARRFEVASPRKRGGRAMSLHVDWDAVQHAGRAARAARSTSRASGSTRSSASRAAACASATCCRGSSSSRSRSCRRTRTRRRAARCAASSSSPST